MRFLILTQYFKPEIGAAPTRLHAMCQQLTSLGHEVEVVTTMPNYPQGKILNNYRRKFYIKENSEEGYYIHRFWIIASQGKGGRRLLSYLTFSLFAFIGIFKAKKPDWIFVNSGPMFLSIPAYVASKIWHASTIFNVADLWPDSIFKINDTKSGLIKNILYRYENWIYKKFDKVTAITDGIKKILIEEKNVPKGKICFLPNGVNTNIFLPQEKSSKILDKHKLRDKFVFCYPGTHGYLHAIDKVLDACKLIEHQKNIVIMLIGDGPEKPKLIAKVQKENISNVIFVDPQPEKDLVPYLSVMDIGLIHLKNTPLAEETRPAKAFPIMAMGKPILFSGFGEGANLVRSIDSGIVIEPENHQLLADTMKNLADGKYNVNQFGENGLAYIKKNHEWKSLIENWLGELN